MKNTYKLLLGSFVAVTVIGGAYLTKDQSKPTSTYKSSELTVKPNKQATSWQAAREAWEDLHRNVNTGLVEQSDYDQARKIAMGISGNKSTLTFQEAGPHNVGGRTRAIEVDPSNDQIMYAGAVSGGVYKSINGGQNWSRLQGWDDNAPVISIASIAISNNGTIYITAGFNDYTDGFQSCHGIYYSTDGGATFAQVAGMTNECVNKIVADRSKPNTVYYTGANGDYVTRLTDGNSATPTVEHLSTGMVSPANDRGIDIKVSPDGQHLLYLTDTRRVYVSNDGGANFARLDGGTTSNAQIKYSGATRIEGCISHEKNANGMYNMAMVISNSGNWGGSWFSQDNGVTWQNISPKWNSNSPLPPNQQFNPLNVAGISPQGNYDLVCSFVKGNPNSFLLGGYELYRWDKTSSTDPLQGEWNTIINANSQGPLGVHSDIHRITWTSAGRAIIGTDGGVYASLDNNTNLFSDLNAGYNATQYFGIAYGPDNMVMGGSQDNSSTVNVDIASSKNFITVKGGDGFLCELSQMSEGAYIASSQYSSISRSRSVYTNGSALTPPPCNGSGNCGPFVTVLRLFEDDNDLDSQDSINYTPDTLVPAGTEIPFVSSNFDKLLKYTTPVDIPANQTIQIQDPLQSLFIASTSNGSYITRDVWRFNASPTWHKIAGVGTGSAFEFSKDGNTLWIGNGSQLVRVTNLDSAYKDEHFDAADPEYKLVITSYNPPTSGTITDISVHPNDPNQVAITAGGSGASSNIAYSTNANASSPTFTAIDGNLPAYVAYGCELIIDPQNGEKMVVGTEFGAYSTQDLSGTVNWTPCNNEIGIVPVYDVRQQWRDWGDAYGNVRSPGRVYLGTFGRGIWYTDDVAGIYGQTEDDVTTTNKLSNIIVYPNPVSNNGNIKFTVSKTDDVIINIYSLQGKMIKTIQLKNLAEGDHNISFNADDFAVGTYIMTFASGNYKEVKKFIKR